MEANAGYAGQNTTNDGVSETTKEVGRDRGIDVWVSVCGLKDSGNYYGMSIWYFCKAGGRGYTFYYPQKVVEFVREYRAIQSNFSGTTVVRTSSCCRPDDEESVMFLENLAMNISDKINERISLTRERNLNGGFD